MVMYCHNQINMNYIGSKLSLKPFIKEKILEVKDLKVSFQTFQGSVQAVRGVSWHLNKKETIAIVGESGCGKTVTIQTVIGLNPKKNGSYRRDLIWVDYLEPMAPEVWPIRN